MAGLEVKLKTYEGPLDLLLDLIKKNEMDIYDIPMVEITRQYLDYLNTMKRLDLDIAGEYLVMAATLIHIKSKMLLPTEKLDEDELEEDPRTELVRKLLEYRAFRTAAKELGMLETERGKVFTRQIADYYLESVDTESVELESFNADLYDLMQAFHNVLKNISKESFHEVFEEVVSIEEKTEEIKGVLNAKTKTSFREILGKRFSKNDLIVTFLSILELIRMKFVKFQQTEVFSDILIEKI